MTYRDALLEAASRLEQTDSPWLDATVLLAHVTGESREKVLAAFPDELLPGAERPFFTLVERRREGHPVAYLTGKKEFYGREFLVGEGILCPRPDTEILVEEALALIRGRGCRRVHDLCTGSGSIALTLALEEEGLNLSASDVSPRAEEIFSKNRDLLSPKEGRGARDVTFTRTSLTEGLSGPYDMIVSNPPYLTTEETLQRMDQGWKEPALALDGGPDGLDLIRRIIPGALPLLSPEGCLMLEAASPQMGVMRDLMAEAGYKEIRILQDLGDRDRVIVGTKPS